MKQLFSTLLLLLVLCAAQAQVGEAQKPARTAAGHFSSSKLYMSELYPNPCTSKLYTDYNLLTSSAKELKIVFYNVLGSPVKEVVLAKNEKHETINVEAFNPGVYFYTVYLDGQSQFTKRLILKR